MSQSPGFKLSVDHNKYLPDGHTVIDAVISVSTADHRRGPAPSAAQVIMIDCSGSMGGDKIVEARRATAVAVDMLNDGVAFAVVAGTQTARMVYPATTTMVPSSPKTREEAKKAIRRLTADGGTAIGTWLELASGLLSRQDAEIKHAILLTDGHNQHQEPHELAATLRRCRDKFVCDSRGLGKDWSAEPLRAIADELHGSAKGLPDARTLSDEFRAMAEAFMSTSIANVVLRVWHPRGGTVRFLKEVHPHVVDLTGRRTAVSELIDDYPIGSWGAETRDYHLSIELPPGNKLFDEVLAAHVRVVVGDEERAEGLVPAEWTDDTVLSTMHELVEHYTGQVELDEATQAGLKALREGLISEATMKLGRAVQIATESDNRDTLRVLQKVVVVQDASTAKVRIREGMEQVDAEMARLASRMTVQWRKDV